MPTWFTLVIGASVFAALTTIFSKIALFKMDSDILTWMRAIIMIIFLTAFLIYNKKLNGVPTLSSKEASFIVLAGISGAISWILYFKALKYGPPTAVASIDKSSILWVFLFSLLFLGQTFSWKSLFGSLLIFGGMLLFLV